MNKLFAILTVFFPFALIAQPALENGNAFFEEPYFDPAFIKQEKIKQVSASVAIKDEGMPIKKKRTKWIFNYFESGLLSHMHKTLDKGSFLDSVSLVVRYNEENKMLFRREKDVFGVHFYRYEYKKDGTLFREVYERPQAYKKQPKVVFFETEHFGDSVYILKYLNSLNRIFKEEFQRVSQNKLPLYYRDKRHITGTNTEKKWVYTESGNVDSLIISHFSPKHYKEVFTYKYNDALQPIEEYYFKNGKQVHYAEIMYKNGRPDAYLKRTEDTKRITIIRFSYTYY